MGNGLYRDFLSGIRRGCVSEEICADWVELMVSHGNSGVHWGSSVPDTNITEGQRSENEQYVGRHISPSGECTGLYLVRRHV